MGEVMATIYLLPQCATVMDSMILCTGTYRTNTMYFTMWYGKVA